MRTDTIDLSAVQLRGHCSLQEFYHIQDKHEVTALSTCHPDTYISEAERQR